MDHRPFEFRNLIRVGSRRWFLQTGLAGVGGMTLPGLLRANEAARPSDRKAVILFWLSGGPSHLDMWDPKPDAPREIRGPFSSIESCVPGVRVGEHLPQQASIMDKLTIIRSVDCKTSNHTPITMQAGNPLARRLDKIKDGDGYPSMGSVVAKFRGSNDPRMPAFVGLAPSWKADVWESGHMGSQFAPVDGGELAGRIALPQGIQLDRLGNRDELRRQFDQLLRDRERTETMANADRYTAQAMDLVTSGHAAKAFDLSQEKDSVRDAYGRDSIGEKALLARRLVEAGVTYVLVSARWGYFDNHGDNVPPWGGIEKGLGPILPTVDRTIAKLVTDLEERGRLDSTLVMVMGEFGRGPIMTKDAGRDHWLNCMSMLLAGGGLKHGQVIGSTDSRGYDIKDRPVRPQDLAATVFKYVGIDLTSHWVNPQGRPIPIVTEGGQPISELI
ncbi:MAG: hypothetical protein FD138_2096 [Planctomycetota bacterium]|nr:MAG: hypothetical protein FD138_2096 [Planctomycetota bacterium]